jgi:hypothetical protein
MKQAAGAEFSFCLRVPDQLTFPGVFLLLFPALAPATRPARRALSTDPATALRAG